jgi:hypothetical protein
VNKKSDEELEGKIDFFNLPPLNFMLKWSEILGFNAL